MPTSYGPFRQVYLYECLRNIGRMSGPTDTIRVLHVEDEPALAEMVGTFLEHENDRIEVRAARDAEEGLAALAEADFDCVVSDHEMPGRNGIEFLKAVREEYADLPFILFTGKGSEAVASDAISAGVTDYLQKGSGTEQYELLANRIVNAVDGDRARRMLRERTRRLETLVSTLPGMVYRCRNEPDWPMETVEGEVEALTGYAAETLERNEVVWGETVIHPDDRDRLWSAVQDALAADGSFEVTYRIVTRDGTTKWVWERGRDVDTGDGEPDALEGFITDITDRKERERRLERMSARLESLFENSPEMIHVHDAEGRIVDVNPRQCAETGYDESELVGKRVWELDPTVDPDAASALWAGMEDGDRRELEGEFRRRDGSTFPVEVHLRRFDIDGEARFMASGRNVSERKRRERKLERLRERTRALNYTRTVAETVELAVEAADGIIGAPLSGVHLVTDDGTRLEPASVADSVPETFDGAPSFERSAPAGSRANLVWEVFRNGEPVHIDDVSASDRLTEPTPAESVVLHPMGDHGLFVISSQEKHAFTETDVLLAEILANYLEAALDRVVREGTLRAREERLERLHDATRDLVRAESPEEVADRAVEAAEGILDFSVTVVRLYDPEENGLVPIAASDAVTDVVPDREVFTPESGSLNWDSFEAGEVRVYDDIETVDAVDSGTGLRSLMLLPVGEHGTISVGETAPAAFDATDEFLARILSTATETAFDELERERELRRSRDELERQNERLEAFTEVVSHDLRNPLNVAEGRVALASEECDSDHLDDVRRAHDRMGDLIEDLLTLARGGDGVGEMEPVDLATFPERCWGTVGGTDGARLVVDADLTIRADRSRLRQLFENLMRNGVEHGSTSERTQSGDAIDHGSAGVTVTVGELDDGFYVADDGPGIPESERDEVFEAGYSTSEDGNGFGLSIVKEIAEAHGWAIDVGEHDGGGARFEVTGVETVE